MFLETIYYVSCKEDPSNLFMSCYAFNSKDVQENLVLKLCLVLAFVPVFFLSCVTKETF